MLCSKKRKVICSLLILILTISSGLVVFGNSVYSETNHGEYAVVNQKSKSEIENEFEKILSEINQSYESLPVTRGPAYEYKTVYETSKKQYKTISGFAGNQYRDGTKFKPGGGFYYSSSGGPKISFSLNIPSPYGKMSFSVGLGNSSSTGEFVEVPDSVYYYKLYVTKDVEIRPYTTYRRTKGSSSWSVYVRGAVPVTVSQVLEAVRTKK
ncbi:MAG: hypothetical protein ACLS8L_08345 [Anaerovoracaceae bacterium]